MNNSTRSEMNVIACSSANAFKKFHLKLILAVAFLSFSVLSANSQFLSSAPTLTNTPTDATFGSYGNSTPWFMGWDNTYLYIGKTGGAGGEACFVYLDIDPLSPSSGGVSGGSNSNGTLTTTTDYGVTGTLPFRADIRLVITPTYLGYSTRNGTGGWNTEVDISSGNVGTSGSPTRTIRFPWTTGSLLAGRPTAFNWLGYCAYSTGIYDVRPAAGNPTGNGASPRFYFYQSVTNTSSTSTTNPFSADQYSFETRDNFTYTSGFASTLHDLTVNGNTFTLQNGITVRNNVVVNSGDFRSSGARTLTMSAAGGTGTLQINNTNGGSVTGTDAGGGNDLNLTVSGGTVTLNGNATTNSDNDKKFFGITVNASSTLALSRGVVCRYGSFTVNGTLQINSGGYVSSSLSSAAAASYGASASLVYNTGGNYTASNMEWPAATTNVPNVTIQNSGTNVTLNSNKTVNSTLTVRSGTTLALSTFNIGSPSSVVVETGATGSTISGSSGTLTLGGNITVNSGSGANGATISCPVALGANRTITVNDDTNAATDLTISGAIGGAFNLEKAGSGTATLSGTSTYTGLTTISNGTLRLGASSSTNASGPLGTTGSGTTVSSGGALDLNGFSLTSTATEALTISGTGFSSTGALTNSGGTTSTWAGTVALAADASVGGSGNITINGVTSGTSRTFTKVGAGTLTLANSSASTLTGSWVVAGGTLSISTFGNHLNSQPLTLGTSTTSGKLLYNSSASGGTTTTVLTVASGGGEIEHNDNSDLEFSANATLNGTLTLNTSSIGNLTFSGILSGSGGLTVSNASTGETILSGANAYTGNTTLTSGTMRITAADRISNSSKMVMNGGIFRTGPSGATGFSEEMGTITVTENSDIRFGTGNHTLRFADSRLEAWTAGKTLTIYNWIGSAGTAATGTNPKLFIGTDGNGLTQAQLDAINFNGFAATGATILSTGEIVPNSSLTITSAKTGLWSATDTWVGGVVPSTNDNVIIASGHEITVSTNTACKTVTFAAGTGGTLSVNASVLLTVSGDITLNSAASASTSCTISGSGEIRCGSITVGSDVSPTGSSTSNIMTSTISNLTIQGTGNLTLRADNSGSSIFVNPRFYLNSGTLTVPGTIDNANVTNNGGAAIRFWMDQGTANGTLILTGSTPWASCANCTTGGGAATYERKLNGSGATVNYAGAAQTVLNTSYTNLTLSGSGVKTLAAFAVPGKLSMQGTATAGTAALTSVGTLEYKGSQAQTASAFEWPATVTNLIIDNSAGVTLPASFTRILSGDLTLTAGSLADGGNVLTVQGNIAGNGTHSGLGSITMTGASKTISGATLANLTLNNASGFSLSGSPTITGNLALTAGTLTVGAQTLTYSGSSITRTSGNIDASNASATLRFSNGTGFTLPASLFTGNINNLTLSGAGGVTLGGATAVAGTLTLTTGTLTTGANTLTYSGSSITRTNGNIDASNASGAVAFTNTGSSLSLPASLFSGTATTFTVNGTGGVTLGGSVSIRTLNLSSGTLTVGSGNTVTITSGGSVVRTSGALANGTSAGTFSFAGTGSVSGTVAFNNVTIDGALTPSTTTTINGTLQINTGSSIVTNSPIFGSSSTLQYNHGGNFAARRTQALEWPSTSGPANLTITNGSWIQLAGARSLTGNVTITSGALQASGQRTLTMAGTNQTFTVSTTSGGGVYGTDNGSGNDLTLAIANGSTTTFTGDVTTTDDDEKKFVSVNVNSGGTLILQRGILVKYGTFTVDGSLQLNSGGYVRGDGTMLGGTAADIRLPVYGSTSTLIYNSGGTYNVGFEWTANAASGAGVPRNVTIGNGVNTTLSFASSGQFRRANGNVTISANSGLTLSSASGGDLYVGGNFTNNGTFTPSSRMVEFVGGAAQTITGSFGTPGSTNNFAFLKISNTSGGVSLGVSTPVLVTNTLELNSGILTTGSNLLSLNSGVAGAISGGSSSSFINGSLSRAITPATDTWVFPVGKGSTYLPYGITNPVGSSPVVTVEAFTSNAGGTPGAGLSSLSTAEYWSAVNTGTLTSAIISLAKTSIGSNTGIGFTTTPPTGGTYANLGGSITNTLITSNTVTASSTVGSMATTTYFVLGTTGYITTQAGDWNSTSTWQSGVVPPAGSTVTINHAVTVNSSVTAAPASVTINASRSLTFGASGALTATNVTNNGSIVMTAGGTLTIAAGGTLANGTSTFTRGTGTVAFAGSGVLTSTISGTIEFNNVTLEGGANFGSGSTVHGTLRINSGGFVSSNAPTYANTSTLLYNTTGTYGRGTEWSTTSGAGYPNNVQISNTTTLNLGANGGTGTARQLAGNLTVDANSTLTMNASGEVMTQALIVKGNYINNGTTTLSSSIGGDLVLEGNLTDNNVFTANGRAIFFRGGNTQSITSNTDPLDIDVMRVEKSGGEIVLLQNLLVDETADPIQFAGTSSILNLNGRTATFGKADVTSAITMNSTSAIKGSSTSSLSILGNGAFGTIRFDQTSPGTTNLLQNFTVNRGSTGSVTLGNNLSIVGALTLTNGTLTVGGNILTYSGSTITRTSGTIDASNSSATLIFSNGTGVTLPASLFTGNIQNLTMSGAGGITLGSATTVAGTLTLTTGDITTTSTNTLTLGASATISGGTATSHIIGPLDRTLTNGSSFTYPVGTATNYRPLILQSVSATGNPVVRVTMDDAGAINGDANTISATLSSARNWRVQTISGTFNSATLNITETGLTDGVSLIAKSNNNQAGTYVSVGASTVSSGTITSPAGQTPGFFVIATACVNPTAAGTIAGNQGICSGGDPAAFTSSAAASGNTGTLEYRWQFSSTSDFSSDVNNIDASNSETYNPPSGLSATRYYRRQARVNCKADWTGAVSSNILTVTVTNPPNAGTLSGTQAICVGGTTDFNTNGNAGGAWTSDNESAATVNSTTGVVTGVAAGTATITYTVTGTGGCSNATATRSVTVTAAPNAGTLSGTQGICVGGTTDFNSSGNSGGSWTTSDALVATVNSSTGVVSGVAAGTATITYTVTGTGGCSNAEATRTVTVTAAPNAGTLSGTQAICVGGTTDFNTNGNAGGAWTSDNEAAATVNSTTGVVTGVAAGTATITYTVTGTGGCSNATATRIVTVTAAPNAGTLSGTQTVCAGGTTDFNTDGNTGGTWTTSNASVATVNGSTGVVTGVAAGTATITYTVTGSGGCSNATATRDVTVNATPSITGTTPASRCGSGPVTLTATSSTGTINWYDASTGGNLLNTGGSYNITNISSTTTYYVDATATNGCTTASRTVVIATVNPNVTPSVTIAASPSGAIVTGTSVTFTATPTNGGNLPTYVWRRNGNVISGATASTYITTTLANNDQITVTMTSNAACLTGSPSVTSSAILMSVSSGNKTWNVVSGNWSEGANWSPAGVPTSADNITINSGTVTMNVNYTLPSGKTLTIGGTGQLIVAPGNRLTIAGVADFGGRPVTLKSTSAGTASIGQITGTLNGATNVTVERYMTARRKWRALTAPLTASTNNGSIYNNWQNGGSIATPNTGAIIWTGGGSLGTENPTTGLANGGFSNSMLSLTTATNSWAAVTSTKATGSLFDASRNYPYMLFFTGPYNKSGTYIASGTLASTLSATGTLRTGNITMSSLATGWHMIGNPYASSINIGNVAKSGLNAGGYIWNPGGAGTGVFTPITLSSGVTIQSGQAFFVYSTAGAGSLTFEEADKVSSSSNSVFRTDENSYDGDLKIELNKYVGGNTELNDVAIVNYKSRAEAGLPKLAQFYENMSIYQDNLDYGLTTRTLNNGEDNIQLRMWQMKEANYQIKIDLSNMKLPAGSTAVLQDAFLNKETSLSTTETNKVDFNVTSNAASTGQRFRIVLRRANVPVTSTETPSYQIYPNPVQKGGNMQLEFRNQTAGKYEVVIYSMTGVRVQKAVVGHNGGTAIQQIALDQRLSAGSYLVEVIGEDGFKKQLKLVLQ